MSTLKNLFLFTLLFTILFSCKKTTSSFKLDKYYYNAGEYILIENTNPKKNQLWELYDNFYSLIDTSADVNPQFVLSYTAPDGKYHIKLYDNKKDKKRNIYKIHYFEVQTLKGEVDFQGGNSNTYSYIYIDGIQYDKGYGSSFSKDLPVGTYYLKVLNDQTVKFNEVVKVTNDNVLVINL